jgi:hypothetical protein
MYDKEPTIFGKCRIIPLMYSCSKGNVMASNKFLQSIAILLGCFLFAPPCWAVDVVTMGNLMWQQSDDGVDRTWIEANNYCESLSLGGFADWRLPTKDELKGIVYCSNGKPTPLDDWDYNLTNDENLITASCGGAGWPEYTEPTINNKLSCTTNLYGYRLNWSSNLYNCNTTGCAWFTNFNGGVTNYTQIDSNIAVRCVRDVNVNFPWPMFLQAINGGK